MLKSHYPAYVSRNTNPVAESVIRMKSLIKSQRVPAERSRPANSPSSKSVPRSLAARRRAARDCKACDLWKNATQTIFGEGPTRAKLFLVGEQPGDQEDLPGTLSSGLQEKFSTKRYYRRASIAAEVYVTNVVKHFKWAPAQRGKRRIHKKPRHSEIEACRPWLDAELRTVRPDVVVCLGATAAQALLGREFSVTRQRGQLVESPLAPKVVATVHPSSILRAPDATARQAQMQEFVRDLTRIAALL